MTENVNINNKDCRSGGGFAGGVAVLTLSTVIVKLIGLIYKIPMLKHLGEEGMGYFNSAYEIFTLFYMVATAGLPVAISILVAKNAEKGNAQNVKRIYGVSLVLLLCIGVLGTAVLYLGAETFSQLIGNSGAADSIMAIAPMAFFICVSSAVRGYFQGRQNMVPTAVSQIIEAVGKLFPGLLLAVIAINVGCGMERAAAYASLGIALGAGMSMIYLLASKLFEGDISVGSGCLQSIESRKYIVKGLASIALPIAFSSAVISMTRVTDLVMILRRLQSIGYTEQAANSIYGSYSTLAVSMFNLPASLVTPIALTLVPVLTAAVNGGGRMKEERTLNASFKLCGLIIIPSALGMSVFSRPILELVFGNRVSAINIAAPLLSVLAISVFFSCLMTVSNAVLQAYGKEKKTIVSMLVGAGLKTALAYILIGDPNINVYGAPISTLVCDIAVSTVNIAYIRRTTKLLKGASELFGRSLAAAIISVGGCAAAYYGLVGMELIESGGVTTVAAMTVTATLYAIVALRINAVGKEEIMLLPRGERIYGVMKKIKLIK